ncbi:MAG: hypothetical protein LBL98_08990 [Ruminococcus sp.]|jgi:GH25 family lysozyme M1 (1,4-beta-N-acetylmuramidase)|nr:hypothetical protein [Ruminococcus sp.]
MKQLKKIISAFLVIMTVIFSVNITVFAETEQGVAGDGNTVDRVEIPARKIVINGNKKTMNIGDTANIRYTLYPKNSDDFIIMKSLYTNIATVTQDGVITAVGPGEGIITVRTGSGKKGKVTVVVLSPEESTESTPTRIDLDDEYVNLKVGETSKIVPHIFPPEIKNPIFEYRSLDKSIADVRGGVITAKSPGKTSIEVTSGGQTTICHVYVYRNRYKGIDVSKWQGDIDWAAVKASGIQFAVIRAGYGKATPDEKLDANVKGAEENFIPYGFYHYTYAKTPEEAVIEAEFFVSQIRGYSPELPIVLDIEEPFYKKMSKKQVEAILNSFMKVLTANGYSSAVYSNAYFFTNQVETAKIAYPIWVASWGDTEKLNAFYDGSYFMWQYSASGKVEGINGDVDLNYLYY